MRKKAEQRTGVATVSIDDEFLAELNDSSGIFSRSRRLVALRRYLTHLKTERIVIFKCQAVKIIIPKACLYYG